MNYPFKEPARLLFRSKIKPDKSIFEECASRCYKQKPVHQVKVSLASKGYGPTTWISVIGSEHILPHTNLISATKMPKAKPCLHKALLRTGQSLYKQLNSVHSCFVFIVLQKKLFLAGHELFRNLPSCFIHFFFFGQNMLFASGKPSLPKLLQCLFHRSDTCKLTLDNSNHCDTALRSHWIQAMSTTTDDCH